MLFTCEPFVEGFSRWFSGWVLFPLVWSLIYGYLSPLGWFFSWGETGCSFPFESMLSLARPWGVGLQVGWAACCWVGLSLMVSSVLHPSSTCAPCCHLPKSLSLSSPSICLYIPRVFLCPLDGVTLCQSCQYLKNLLMSLFISRISN